MDIKTQNRLKLRNNEVIKSETAYEDFLVRQQMGKLGIEWGGSYPATARSYFHKSPFLSLDRGVLIWLGTTTRLAGVRVTPAVEWLNRHNVFVYGQEIWVPVLAGMPWLSYYVAPGVAVREDPTNREHFREGQPFETCISIYPCSPYPEWKDLTEPMPEPEPEPEPKTEKALPLLRLSQHSERYWLHIDMPGGSGACINLGQHQGIVDDVLREALKRQPKEESEPSPAATPDMASRLDALAEGIKKLSNRVESHSEILGNLKRAVRTVRNPFQK